MLCSRLLGVRAHTFDTIYAERSSSVVDAIFQTVAIFREGLIMRKRVLSLSCVNCSVIDWSSCVLITLRMVFFHDVYWGKLCYTCIFV